MIAFLLFGRCLLIKNHHSLTKWTFVLITSKCYGWDWLQSSEFHPIYLWFWCLWMGPSIRWQWAVVNINGGGYSGHCVEKDPEALCSVRESDWWLPWGRTSQDRLIIVTLDSHVHCSEIPALFSPFPLSLFLESAKPRMDSSPGRAGLEPLRAWFWFKGVSPWDMGPEWVSEAMTMRPNNTLIGL